MPHTVTLNHQVSEAAPGMTLFDCAERVGVRVPSSCRKQGKCRECLVEVVSGGELLSPLSPEEAYLQPPFRLACRAQLGPEPGAVGCHTLRRGRMQIVADAEALPAAAQGAAFDPAVTRDGDWVLLDGEPLVRAAGPLHGLAVDIGTTTVALRLVDLSNGQVRARAAFENPQRFGGSDVLSRIAFDAANPGRLLQRTLMAYLSHALEELPADPRTINEVVVAGNPTMRDLFFGLDVQPLGQKPYHSVLETEFRAGRRSSTAVTSTAAALHLPVAPQARVYGLPVIASHVGGDAAANLLALGLAEEEQLVAVMDLGTNTELLVGNRHRLLAASCPAGPAFEGGGVTCGMPALPGAIERVRVDAAGQFQLEVIGGGPAEGICGSGLVDLLSELLRTGRMTPLGRFTNGEKSIVLDPAGAVVFRERDISELAQAKGANISGLQIVFKRLARPFRTLDRFYFAGGFARHLNLAAAQRIGLIPELPADHIVQAGNLALAGAALALCSRTRRAALEQAVARVEHVELEEDPEFFDHFALGCRLQPVAGSELEH